MIDPRHMELSIPSTSLSSVIEPVPSSVSLIYFIHLSSLPSFCTLYGRPMYPTLSLSNVFESSLSSPLPIETSGVTPRPQMTPKLLQHILMALLAFC